MELEFSGEINLSCEKCGADLKASEQKRRGVWEIAVEPCEDCIEEAYKKGAADQSE